MHELFAELADAGDGGVVGLRALGPGGLVAVVAAARIHVAGAEALAELQAAQPSHGSIVAPGEPLRAELTEVGEQDPAVVIVAVHDTVAIVVQAVAAALPGVLGGPGLLAEPAGALQTLSAGLLGATGAALGPRLVHAVGRQLPAVADVAPGVGVVGIAVLPEVAEEPRSALLVVAAVGHALAYAPVEGGIGLAAPGVLLQTERLGQRAVAVVPAPGAAAVLMADPVFATGGVVALGAVVVHEALGRLAAARLADGGAGALGVSGARQRLAVHGEDLTGGAAPLRLGHQHLHGVLSEVRVAGGPAQGGGSSVEDHPCRPLQQLEAQRALGALHHHLVAPGLVGRGQLASDRDDLERAAELAAAAAASSAAIAGELQGDVLGGGAARHGHALKANGPAGRGHGSQRHAAHRHAGEAEGALGVGHGHVVAAGHEHRDAQVSGVAGLLKRRGAFDGPCCGERDVRRGGLGATAGGHGHRDPGHALDAALGQRDHEVVAFAHVEEEVAPVDVGHGPEHVVGVAGIIASGVQQHADARVLGGVAVQRVAADPRGTPVAVAVAVAVVVIVVVVVVATLLLFEPRSHHVSAVDRLEGLQRIDRCRQGGANGRQRGLLQGRSRDASHGVAGGVAHEHPGLGAGDACSGQGQPGRLLELEPGGQQLHCRASRVEVADRRRGEPQREDRRLR